jgi:hypothetical protein
MLAMRCTFPSSGLGVFRGLLEDHFLHAFHGAEDGPGQCIRDTLEQESNKDTPPPVHAGEPLDPRPWRRSHRPKAHGCGANPSFRTQMSRSCFLVGTFQLLLL